MDDLESLVWHRLWLGRVNNTDGTAADMVPKFYHRYTEEQIDEEINRQTTKENK